MLYAVRKRSGRWTVCSDDKVVLQFENYDEAVATARGAVTVLAHRTSLHEATLPGDDGHTSTAAPLAPLDENGAIRRAMPRLRR
jgi:hypothetical protein